MLAPFLSGLAPVVDEGSESADVVTALASSYPTVIWGWIGEDTSVDGAGVPVSLNSRLGNPAVPVGGAFEMATGYSRKGIITATSTDKQMRVSFGSLIVKSIVVVARSPSLPFNQYQCAAIGYGGNMTPYVMGSQSASNLYQAGTATYIDGVATAAMTTGLHVLGATYPTSTNPNLAIGGYPSLASRGWIAAIYAAFAFSSVLTAGEMAGLNTLLRSYYP